MFEPIILSNLFYNEEYRTEVLPFLKEEYFHDNAHCLTFKLLKEYTQKYDTPPTKEALLVNLDQLTDVNENQFKEAQEFISQLEKSEQNKDWLPDEFCQDKAICNAIYKSVDIYKGEKANRDDYYKLPLMMHEALKVSIRKAEEPVISAQDFIKDLKSPPYLIQNLFRKGWLYSITGLTGSGKTAVALLFAVHVAMGKPIGDLKVKEGPVLYIAGENPTDVGERLKAMFPNKQPIPANLHLLPRPGRKEVERAIAHLIAKGTEISFIVIDTSAA